MNSSPKALMTRILVGYLGLYPTLLLVLTLLKPITHHQSFPMMVLIEVIVLVPVTQLISFPLAGWANYASKNFKEKLCLENES